MFAEQLGCEEEEKNTNEQRRKFVCSVNTIERNEGKLTTALFSRVLNVLQRDENEEKRKEIVDESKEEKTRRDETKTKQTR